MTKRNVIIMFVLTLLNAGVGWFLFYPHSKPVIVELLEMIALSVSYILLMVGVVYFARDSFLPSLAFALAHALNWAAVWRVDVILNPENPMRTTDGIFLLSTGVPLALILARAFGRLVKRPLAGRLLGLAGADLLLALIFSAYCTYTVTQGMWDSTFQKFRYFYFYGISSAAVWMPFAAADVIFIVSGLFQKLRRGRATPPALRPQN